MGAPMICPLCHKDTDELHYAIERHVLDMIKSDHPEWVESDGSCKPCFDYYESLDTLVELID